MFSRERKAGEESLKDVKGILKPFPDVSEIAMQDKQLPIPKALQQKSSALIQPLAPVSTASIASNTPETPHLDRDSAAFKPKHSIPNLKFEKMDVEPVTEQPPVVGSTESTPMELMSPVSGTSTPAGCKSISPTLLAASLVAVCSATSSPSVTSAPATSMSDLTKESIGISSRAPLEAPPLGVTASASLGVATTLSSSAQCTLTSTSTSVTSADLKTSTFLSTSVTAASGSSAITSTPTSVIQSEPNTVTSTSTSVTPSGPRTSTPLSTSETTGLLQPNATSTGFSTGSCLTVSKPSTVTSTCAGLVSSEPTTVTSTSITAIPSEPCSVSSDAREAAVEKIPKITAVTMSGVSTNKTVDSNADVSQTKTSGEGQYTTEENKTQVAPCTNLSSKTETTSSDTNSTGKSTTSRSTPGDLDARSGSSTEKPLSPSDTVSEAVNEPCDKSDK